jgi:very-short-patch-repair endonuclease
MTERSHRIDPVICDRARALRRGLTPMERILWARLRDRRLAGLRFRRQHPLGEYIVDFYCPSVRVVIEIDGDTHAQQEAYDRERTDWLKKNGYRVIRFANGDVIRNLDNIMEAIRAECQTSEPPNLSLRGRGRAAGEGETIPGGQDSEAETRA